MTTEGPKEALPGEVPSFIVFFLPNIWGVVFAAAFEYLQAETKLANLLAGHPFALFGMGIFVLANTASYLSGCVVMARLEYDVKLPNLYADKKENKNAVVFNCIQRGHQNLVENYAHYVMSAIFTALVADRPNVAGMSLIVVSVFRYLFAAGYKSPDITRRFPPFLLSMFAGSVGVGYAFLVALSVVNLGPFATE